jgi:hypothetical protein
VRGIIYSLILLAVIATGCINTYSENKQRWILYPAPPTTIKMDTETGETYLFWNGVWMPLADLEQKDLDHLHRQLQQNLH